MQGDVNNARSLFFLHHPDVNKKDFNKRTALWIASYKGHAKVVRFLLDNGAATEIETGDVVSLVSRC